MGSSFAHHFSTIMIYVLGFGLNPNKPLTVGLTGIHGIGLGRSRFICDSLNLDPSRRIKSLSKKEISAIVKIIEEEFEVGSDLKRRTRQNIARLIEIQCYRGVRHQKSLPVRGQRTSTNAKTQKRLGRQHRTQN